MPMNSDPDHTRQHALLLILFSLFLFASPFTNWWASASAGWLLPYLLWLLIILIGAWLHLRSRRHDV